jgi:hypothetical protein
VRKTLDTTDPERVINALAAKHSGRMATILVAEIEIPGEVLLISTRLRQALTGQGELQA